MFQDILKCGINEEFACHRAAVGVRQNTFGAQLKICSEKLKFIGCVVGGVRFQFCTTVLLMFIGGTSRACVTT